MRGEELDGVVDAHRQHFADALAFVRDGERVVVEAPAAAGIADHAHVRQEAHLDATQALPVAASQRPPAVLKEKRDAV